MNKYYAIKTSKGKQRILITCMKQLFNGTSWQKLLHDLTFSRYSNKTMVLVNNVIKVLI